MAKKKFIISESAVRRWQKLATIKPITEMYGMSHDKPMEEEAEMYEEEEAEMAAEEPPMDMPEPEMDAEAPAAAEGAEDMARSVIMAVADALGVEIDIDGGEEAPMEEPEEEVMQEDALEEETLEEMDHAEDTLEEIEMIDETELTEAVMKRVLGRLKEMTSKKK